MALKSWIYAGGAFMLFVAQVEAQDAQRFSPLTVEMMTPEQKAGVKKDIDSNAYTPTGIASLYARNPGLTPARNAILTQILSGMPDDKSTLPKGLIELASIVTARYWDNSVYFTGHAGLARKVGVSDATIDAVSQGVRPTGATPAELAVYDFTSELVSKNTVSDATFKKTRDFLSERDVIDLIAIIGMRIDSSVYMMTAGTQHH